MYEFVIHLRLALRSRNMWNETIGEDRSLPPRAGVGRRLNRGRDQCSREESNNAYSLSAVRLAPVLWQFVCGFAAAEGCTTGKNQLCIEGSGMWIRRESDRARWIRKQATNVLIIFTTGATVSARSVCSISYCRSIVECAARSRTMRLRCGKRESSKIRLLRVLMASASLTPLTPRLFLTERLDDSARFSKLFTISPYRSERNIDESSSQDGKYARNRSGIAGRCLDRAAADCVRIRERRDARGRGECCSAAWIRSNENEIICRRFSWSYDERQSGIFARNTGVKNNYGFARKFLSWELLGEI